MVRVGLIGCAAFLACIQIASAEEAPPERHLRGEVVTVSGSTVEMKTREGQTERFTIGDKTRVSVASKADLKRIDKNAYVGTTAVAQPDGTLRALEVHIFPEAARGSGEGHRPWDLQAGSSMTNATVAGVGQGGGSTMTNATVSDATSSGRGMRMTLRYKDGEKTVVVPSGTTVVQLDPADRSRLTPGARIFAAVKPSDGGASVADRIVVGKDIAPPM